MGGLGVRLRAWAQTGGGTDTNGLPLVAPAERLARQVAECERETRRAMDALGAAARHLGLEAHVEYVGPR